MVEIVASLATRAGIGSDRSSRLELAVEEWVVNLCRHAYGNRGGTIGIAVRQGSDQLEVEITDEGPPFDPTASPEPDVATPLAEREPGGLGLLLIRRMMDEVSYVRDGNRNVVTFTASTAQS